MPVQFTEENTFNFQRIAPHETATLIPFMMDAKGTTLSEAWITGSINSGLLLQEGKKRPKQEDDDDIIDAELK